MQFNYSVSVLALALGLHILVPAIGGTPLSAVKALADQGSGDGGGDDGDHSGHGGGGDDDHGGQNGGDDHSNSGPGPNSGPSGHDDDDDDDADDDNGHHGAGHDVDDDDDDDVRMMRKS